MTNLTDALHIPDTQSSRDERGDFLPQLEKAGICVRPDARIKSSLQLNETYATGREVCLKLVQ